MIAFGCSHDNVSGPLTSGFTPSLAPDFFSQPQSPHTASCDRSRRSGLNACGPRFFVAIDTTADVFRKFPTPSALSHIVSESSVRANSIRGYSTPINSFVGQVGEPVALGVDTDQGTPSNCVFEGIPPNAVSSYTTSFTLGQYAPAVPASSGNTVFFYSVTPFTGALTATCSVNGVTTQFPPLPIQITSPFANVSVSYGTAGVDQNYSGITYYLHWGQQAFGHGSINWSYSVSGANGGKISVYQFVNTTRSTPSAGTYGTSGRYCADTDIPYDPTAGVINVGGTYHDFDAPALALPMKPLGNLVVTPNIIRPNGTYSVNDHFVDYFMYQSNAFDSIPVAIGTVSWGWAASVNASLVSWNWIAQPTLSRGSESVYGGFPPTWTCGYTAG